MPARKHAWVARNKPDLKRLGGEQGHEHCHPTEVLKDGHRAWQSDQGAKGPHWVKRQVALPWRLSDLRRWIDSHATAANVGALLCRSLSSMSTVVSEAKRAAQGYPSRPLRLNRTADRVHKIALQTMRKRS